MKTNKPLWFLALLLPLILFIAGCDLIGPTSPVNKKSWTLMLYLDGDEVSMQQDFNAALLAMISAEAGSTDKVNVVIQYDRYFVTAEAFGGWNITHRFYYAPGMAPTPEAAIADWGDGQGGREVDMSDPDTLSDFISWAACNYPADHYALLLGDHGYGWRGLMIDMTSLGNFMNVKTLAEVLSRSPVRFDILMLDACVMQMLEVMHELRACPVDIVVGSENLGTTWPLSDIIKAVTSNPRISAEALGRRACDLYYAAHTSDDQITLSALRLAKIGPVSSAVKELADTALSGAAFTAVQAKAAGALSKIEEAVVYSRNGASWETNGGLSIYFPPGLGKIPNDFNYYYTSDNISFAGDADWRNFLFTFYDFGEYQGVITPEVYHARDPIPVMDEDKIDLYDFCRRIVEYP